MERVSVLLGHSSVKITERHYAPWVQARLRHEAEAPTNELKTRWLMW
jgi:integrase